MLSSVGFRLSSLEWRVYTVFGAPAACRRNFNEDGRKSPSGFCWSSAFTRCSAPPPP